MARGINFGRVVCWGHTVLTRLWDGKSPRGRKSAMLRTCSNSSGCCSRRSWPGRVRARTSYSRTCSCGINSASSPDLLTLDHAIGCASGTSCCGSWLVDLCLGWREHLRIVTPDTVVRWHRQGWRLVWRWKSRSRGGRPHLSPEVRDLIVTIARENRLWGTERISGELLKLGIVVSNRSIRR